MSYITPARRMSRLPVQLFARLVSATQALQRAGFDVIIAFGGLKTLREAAVRMYARQYEVALDADTEICILIGAKLAFRRSASAC